MPKIKIYHPFPSICKIDGDNTYGHYLGIKAVNEGIKMAKKMVLPLLMYIIRRIVEH